MTLNTPAEIREITASMTNALLEGDLEQARSHWFQLQAMDDVAPEFLAIGAFIYLQRGEILDALHYIDTLPEDCCPDLKAMCYYLLGDPIWHAQAQALEESPNPLIRQSMSALLAA